MRTMETDQTIVTVEARFYEYSDHKRVELALCFLLAAPQQDAHNAPN